jgi:hypothetical protein
LLLGTVGPPSAIDVGLQRRGVAVAFDFDPGERRGDLGKIDRIERDVGRADVFL